ncbi:MAG: hypothetical protein LBK99_16540 [Opitutaceae bacterium]|jgi:hypothetical protein|nr:hypothetical protein [Opitutaceae bacterium]
MTTSTDLTKKILVVDLSIGCLGTSTTDTEATNEVIKKNAASHDAGRFSKNLLKEPLAPIKRIMGKARRLHREYTLPGLSRGLNVLPVSLHAKYTELMTAKQTEYFEAVAVFRSGYETHKADDQNKLGTLFRPSDYPPAETLDRYFKFDFTVLDMPQGDFQRLDGIYSVRAQELKANYEKRMQEIGETAANTVRKTLAELIGKVAERLSDPEAKVYDSLLQNLRDYLAMVPALNVTNDPEVELVRAEALQKLDVSTEMLRKSQFAREQTALSAQSIVKRFGASGIRKFATSADTAAA